MQYLLYFRSNKISTLNIIRTGIESVVCLFKWSEASLRKKTKAYPSKIIE